MRIGRQAARAIVHVNSHNRGKEIAIDDLCVGPASIGAAFVTEGDVEITIRSEVQIRAVMIVVAIDLIDETNFRIGIAAIWIGARDLIPGEDVVPPGRGGGAAGVPNVEVAVSSVTGVKSEAKETLFVIDEGIAEINNLASDIQEGRASRRGQVGDDGNDALLFDDKKAVGFSRGRDDANGVGEAQAREGIGGGIADGRRISRHLQGCVRYTLQRTRTVRLA